jgi:hypothetical protein
MTTSASPAFSALLFILLIIIAIGQFAFFYWIIRNRK